MFFEKNVNTNKTKGKTKSSKPKVSKRFWWSSDFVLKILSLEN